MKKGKKIALLGVLTALSLITYMIESLFPPLIIPGAKLGLSNVFSLLAIVWLSPFDALLLLLARTTLSAFILGNVSSLLYSLPAGLLSVLYMSAIYTFFGKKVSLLAISVSSAIVHNLVQNIVYCLQLGSFALFSYSPYLVIIAVLAGIVVGVSATLIVNYKKLPFFQKEIE